jgi:GT2 family glycosyltransferase
MPNLAFGAPEEMYVRLNNDKVHALLSEGRLLFDAGGRASFDTFFNSVTVSVWKDHAAIQDLELHLRGAGRFIVRLGMHRIGYAHRWLEERIVNLTADAETIINIESWRKYESGMLYFALEALEPGSLSAGHFATSTAPQREVKLGIVITHFNRKQWVLPAIERIRSELLHDPFYKGRIELVVVDNSQNITAEEAKDITLIPNKNLGGSGGFTRGLLHLKDQQHFTHCLFMDDDASCEIESIRRTYILLSYFEDANRTVAGSLLRDQEPFRLFEKGAIFEGYCIPLKSGGDMRHVHDLLWAEYPDASPMYAGWWFFAFNLNSVKNYPFPFFVRGDDIRFGMDNKFDITTANGICCWGEDFSLKSGPLPLYYDMRNHAITMLTALDFSRIKFFLIIAKFVFGQLLSYNYASAKACVMALNDVKEGPDFFRKNIDMVEVRRRISMLGPSERLEKMDKSNYKLHLVGSDESRIRKLFRLITINGFLLPTFMLKNRIVFQHKSFRGSFREIFLAKSVYYGHEPSGVAYIAHHHKRLFVSIVAEFFKSIFWYAVFYKSISDNYKKLWPEMTSEKFWRDVYSK